MIEPPDNFELYLLYFGKKTIAEGTSYVSRTFGSK